MIRRLKVAGYKSLYGIDLRVPPLAVLIGPNSSGKSNLLDALQLLARSVTGATLEEAFDRPHRGMPIESFSFPEGGLDELVKKDRLAFSIEVDLRLSDATVDSVDREIRELCPPTKRTGKPTSRIRDRNLRYRLEIEMLPRSGALQVSDEHLAAVGPVGKPKHGREPFIGKRGDRIRLANEARARAAHFSCGRDRTVISTQLYAPHHPHPVAVRRELEKWLFFYFEPRKHMRSSDPIREVRNIGRLGENLSAFYRTLQALNPRQFDATAKTLNLLLPWADGIDVKVNRRGEIDLRVRENGRVIPASVLSEGTLRMLGLLALSGSGMKPALVGLEEPETGVHPGRLPMIADLLANRAIRGDTQYVVTTHSSLLADLVPHDSLLFVRRDAGHTEISPFTDWGPLYRRRRADGSQPESKRGAQASPLPVSERILRGDFDA